MPPAYAQLNAPWEAALVGSTLDEVKNAAVRYEIDLRSLFIQYANGAEMMSAARFFEFAYDTKLTQDSGDADGFFRMCLKTSYKRSLKIGFDRFLAALARIVDNSAVTNDKTVPNACDLLFQYHIAPTMQGRDAWFWMGTKGSSAPGRFAPRRIPPTLDYVGTHLPLVAVQPGEQDVEVNHREGNFFSFDERDFSKYGNFRKKMELEAGEGRPAENNGTFDRGPLPLAKTYLPTCVEAAWVNHSSGVEAQDLGQVMLDYTANSVLESFDHATGEKATFQGVEQIAIFYEGLFRMMADRSAFNAPVEAVTEEPKQVFLVWSCPSSGVLSVSETFLYDDDFKIVRHNFTGTFA